MNLADQFDESNQTDADLPTFYETHALGKNVIQLKDTHVYHAFCKFNYASY